ncbi:hypothetical protein TBLA_0G03120 [Henningerozyma blattae CBS 6284]|uniref:Amino acid permease/ SLC12A domain-containing protein n=1 Tax=Henningerozyma blattae (strain ATCC 34711 / CBS 6284 / DSM 70876 / NBRC 10599 / NRRL Y-10934 / UCD 77-7) TaxID=1071380 RepID=I2H797_HENB6|nr:hypothetical protein TBLA_0G03120 [Tetrapisispora blattae CBS 6284]CCH62249.1 hypothetical protein TBLA_0G03120 [Tetrapisispora blattae CBS 6284]
MPRFFGGSRGSVEKEPDQFEILDQDTNVSDINLAERYARDTQSDERSKPRHRNVHSYYQNWIDSFKRAEPVGERRRRRAQQDISTTNINNMNKGDESDFYMGNGGEPSTNIDTAYDMNSNEVDPNNKKNENIYALNDDLEDGTTSIAASEDMPKKGGMKARHVIMMTLATGIGTGLLVANAKSLHFSGPAGLVVGYFMVSFVTYFVVQAAGEMAIAYPTLPGGFNTYQSLFISKPFGFATVWIFALNWLTILPLELITSSITVKYWTTSINPDIFVLIFYLFLLFVHFIGLRLYAEAEFFFNSCKILMITGFIIFSIVVNCGGAGHDGYIGGKYWHDPGPFASDNGAARFKEVCYVLINAYFSYGGTELYVLSVNEQENPRKAVPVAAKTSVYRVAIIYLLTMILIGFNVPYNSPDLMGNANSKDASPYVLAAQIHGVKIVPHFINAVILLSVISVANSALFAGPRLLATLAEQGFAPKFLTYVDRAGRPLLALCVCSLFGVIAFAATSKKEDEVFTWLAAIAGLSELFAWSGILLSHIRFRWAMKYHGKSMDEVGYKAITGIWGSYYGLFFNLLVLIAQFWVALSAPGSGGQVTAISFFESYLAFVIWVFFYLCYMIYNKDWTILIPLKDIDVDYQRRIYDADFLRQEKEESYEKYKQSNIGKKIYAWLWTL